MNAAQKQDAPLGWKKVQLRDVARITAGGDYDPETASPVETDRHPFPVFANAIERKAFHSYSSTSKHPAGAVTITARGTLGFSQFRDKPFTAIGRLLVVWPNSQFDGRYLAEYLNSQVEFAVESTGVPQLTGPQAGSYEILIPKDVTEQEAIAEALSDADALIEGLERLIAKKRLIKQGAMQDLLTVKRRLPGFSGEWVERKLGTIATFGKGKGLPKSDVQSSGEISCIHYGSLFRKQPGIIENLDTFTTDFAGATHSQYGNVLMPTSDVTPSGLAVASCIMLDDVLLGGDILVIRPHRDALDGRFLASVIRQARKQIMELVSGTTVFHIYASGIGRFELAVPPLDEQRRIVEVLTDMDAEIQALETRLVKARQVKEGMMQNLLTGRIRLV